MAELKTKPTGEPVKAFLDSIADDTKRDDSFEILEMMKEATDAEPQMWGPGIIGFGHYHYKYESGREGDWFLVGFSPRKQNLTLYIMSGFSRYPELLARLGKHSTGKSCLYVKRLNDIDKNVLREMIRLSVQYMRSKYR